jgi:hypothetical protein
MKSGTRTSTRLAYAGWFASTIRCSGLAMPERAFRRQVLEQARLAPGMSAR